jgi:hypothetical protein
MFQGDAGSAETTCIALDLAAQFLRDDLISRAFGLKPSGSAK